MSKRRDSCRMFQPHVWGAYSGNRIAPSLSDFDSSRNKSILAPIWRPKPLHPGHIPFGSLKENRCAPPMDGVPARENKRRKREYMSVVVPTVEWEPPPKCF